MSLDNIYTEKYRPQSIEECILPKRIKEQFKEMVNKGICPNLILAGGPGVGKTTIAKALLKELDADYIVINGSMNGGIDTLRNEIARYASSMSFSGNRKYVILDEADYLNPNSTQPALRNFMEEFSKNCGFILTCNYPARIIEPLHSRCSVVQFNIDKNDLPELAMQFLARIEMILAKENIKSNKKVLMKMIKDNAPDWRRVLNEIQRNSASGVLDETTVVTQKDLSTDRLVKYLKEKNWDEIRKWVGENSDISSEDIFRTIYNKIYDIVDKKYVPLLVTLMADYQYKAAFVADQEINMVAFLTTVMMECEFKS